MAETVIRSDACQRLRKALAPIVRDSSASADARRAMTDLLSKISTACAGSRMYKAFRDFCEKGGSILKPSERDAIYAFAEKFGYAYGNRFDTIAEGHSERYMSRWRLLGASAQCAEAEINLQVMVKKLSQ